MITTSITSHLEKKKTTTTTTLLGSFYCFSKLLEFFILIPVVYSLDLISWLPMVCENEFHTDSAE
jgi:hypothetical protein